MEDAPVRDLSAGVNQQGVRAHNERLIMSMIQRHGEMPGAELAKRLGLSPQTVSVILRALEADGLIEKGDPQRGQVGKPRVPMRLRPSGAHSVGLNIGRRSAGLVLADLGGRILDHRALRYDYPRPDQVMSFLRSGLAAFRTDPAHGAARIAGIGVASPYMIWEWPEAIGAPHKDLQSWQTFDLEAAIAAFTDLPVYRENDATAACEAEHLFGRGRAFQDYVCIYIGSFIGGGVVLNNAVFRGATGNAGALGPLPAHHPDGSEAQLLDVASLHLLERSLRDAGIDPQAMWTEPQDWAAFEPHVSDWIASAAPHLARAALMVTSVIDFEAVLIDGPFPADVRTRLVAATEAALAEADTRGLIVPRIEPGSIGRMARELGAATAPLLDQFLLTTSLGVSAA